MKTEEQRDDRYEEELASAAGVTEPVESGSDPLAVVQGVEPGMILGGRYEVGPVLGAGGAGRVFAALDRALNERLALKVLRGDRARDRGWIRRLAREVKIARLMRHPNVCRVFELGNEDGIWFITMELAEGGTLRDVLRERRGASQTGAAGASPAPPWEERLEEARAVCAGLAAIHAVGIVHRDVTPGNVLRMGDGRLVLSDFGLAIAAQESTTFLGGTPHYMAPEVVAGRRADQRSDVYQLGLVLHEVLFGRRAEWRRIEGREALKVPVDPHLSTPAEEEVASLCAECLQSDPAVRPANAVAVAGRLAAAEQARPRGPWGRAWRRAVRAGRSPGLRLLVGAGIFLAIGVQAGRIALRPNPCRAGVGRIASVWGVATKETMRRAFLSSGSPLAAATFERVTRLLDDHVRLWLASYADACEATQIRGEQSAEVLDLRMTCLNDDLDSLSALARVLSETDGAIVGRAVEAASHLDDLRRCSDVHRLRSASPLPRDPIIRRAVTEQFELLNRANALLQAGRFRLSAPLAGQVAQAAEKLNYCPLMSRALALEGLGLLDNDARAPGILRAAARSSQSCGDDRSFAMAASGLVLTDGRIDPELAQAWFCARYRGARACWRRSKTRSVALEWVWRCALLGW